MIAYKLVLKGHNTDRIIFLRIINNAKHLYLLFNYSHDGQIKDFIEMRIGDYSVYLKDFKEAVTDGEFNDVYDRIKYLEYATEFVLF